jgi:hypothetical protein
MYAMMSKDEKKDYSRLLALEINSYLKKIYNKMKRKARLKPQSVRPEQIKLLHASHGATKTYEFKLNNKEEVAKGNVGKVVVVTRGLKDNAQRKQRALFIAAEFYVYHAFANHHDPVHFDSVKNQNQYKDLIKKVFGAANAHETRDQAIRYVIEEIGEHKLAHYRDNAWFVGVAKLKEHHPHIAELLGSSEKVFKEAFRKQHHRFTPLMMKQEEDLVRKEIEDLDHIIGLLKESSKKKHKSDAKKLINIHIANLKTFKKFLSEIMDNLERWVVVDKKEHAELRKRKHMEPGELHNLLLDESKAEKIDINKVHIVFDHFKKEKINILQDLELLDKMRASRHKTHHK